MYKKVILILFVVLAVSSAIYALLDRRPVTTSSDEAYKAYQKGQDYYSKLYTREALQEYERAIKLDPQFAMAHFRAASLYYEFDQKEKYEESREKALALLDKVKDIERLQILHGFASIDKNKDDVEKYSKELIDRYPDHFEAVHIQAHKLYDEQKFEEAADASLRALKINPEYAPSYNLLGYISYFLGENEKSLEYFKKYAEMAEGQANPHDSRGEVLMYLGYYDEALKEFMIADSIKPNLEFVLTHMGDVYSAKWMFRDAIGAYMKTAELASNERMRVEQNMKISSCYYYMDKADEGIALLEETVPGSPDDIDLHSRLGSLYALTGDMDKALVELGIVKGLIARELASGDYPDSVKKRTPPSQLFLESRIAQARGNYQEAADYLKQVLEQIKPYNSSYTWRRLGEIYLEAGMPDSTIAVISQALERNPNDALCLFRLSEAYQARNMKDEQTEALKRFLTITKDTDENISFIRQARQTLSRLEEEIVS